MDIQSEKLLKNISTEFYLGRTTIPIEIRKSLGITEDNEGEFEVIWNVEGDNIFVKIIKKKKGV